MNNTNWNEPLVIAPKKDSDNFSPEKRKFSKKKVFLLALFVVVLIFLASFGIRLFKAYKMNQGEINSVQVIEAVNKIYLLPSNEQPKITTVTNPDELRYQPFFINTEVGDQVIVYTEAKKAILYRPSINKIIEASSLR